MITNQEAGTVALIQVIKEMEFTNEELLSISALFAQHVLGDDKTVIEYFVELKNKSKG